MDKEEFVKEFLAKAWESGDWIPIIIFGAMIFGFDKLPDKIGHEAKVDKTE